MMSKDLRTLLGIIAALLVWIGGINTIVLFNARLGWYGLVVILTACTYALIDIKR